MRNPAVLNRLIVLFILTCISSVSLAQRQVVVMRKGKVVSRYNAGDFIQYSTSTPRKFERDLIMNLTDTTIVLRNDTVAIHQIRLVEYHPTGLSVEKAGKDCIVAGALLFLGDIINVTLVQDQPYETDRGVVVASVALVTTGVVLRILGHQYMKIRLNNRIWIVNSESPLYKKPFKPQQP